MCDAIHPELADVTCILGEPRDHDAHLGLSGYEQVEWENPNYVPPAPKITQGSRKDRRKGLEEMADRIKEARLSDPTENTVGQLRVRPRDTEEAAAFAVMPRTGTQRLAVLETIRDSEAGMCDEDIMVVLNMNPSSVRPRRQELEMGGWVMDSGLRRQVRSGQEAIVWKLTPEAVEALSSSA